MTEEQPESRHSSIPGILTHHGNELARRGSNLEMDRDELLQRISIDPAVCFGKPCIRGTRIWVSLIVERLADGISERDLLFAYPQLESEDIRAALCYAAEMTRERVVPVATDNET